MSAMPIPECGPDRLPVDAVDDLLTAGALVVRGASPRGAVEAVDEELRPAFERTPFSAGRFYGDRTVRFGRVFARSDGAGYLALHDFVHGVAAKVLARCHRGHSISFAQAIAVHPGSPVQAPHRDGEMWPVGTREGEHLVSVMWPLTRFDARTGGTRVWTRGADPAVLPPAQPALEPGDALVFLGSTTHGAGENASGEVRRGLVIGYAAGWLIPAENPTLAYPPRIASRLPRELAALLGYRRVAPNLNNYDCRCPSELLEGADREDARGVGAIDELHPEQVEGLERFYASLAAADS